MKGTDSGDIADLKKEIQTLKNENKRLRTFSEIGRTFFTERSIEKLLPLIMSEISECIEADRSTLFLIDWDRMELNARQRNTGSLPIWWSDFWKQMQTDMGNDWRQFNAKLGQVASSGTDALSAAGSWKHRLRAGPER